MGRGRPHHRRHPGLHVRYRDRRQRNSSSFHFTAQRGRRITTPRRSTGRLLARVHRAQRGGDVDLDASYVAEEIGFRWIEVIPLDANGSPTGASRSVTPKDGHVMVFDITAVPDGSALLVWRNDDAPSGSGGRRGPACAGAPRIDRTSLDPDARRRRCRRPQLAQRLARGDGRRGDDAHRPDQSRPARSPPR